MRAKSVLSFVLIGVSVLAIASNVSRARIPGSELTLLVEAEIKEEGDALKDLDEDAKDLLRGAREFSFVTKDGVNASIMRYEPKDEYLSATREWGRVIADGIESVSDESTKVQSRELGKFGDLDGHLISMSLAAGTVIARAEFVVIAGKKEIILIALTAAESDDRAMKTQKSILDSLEYGDSKFTDRKLVKQRSASILD